jgi:cation:H+ antiporter
MVFHADSVLGTLALLILALIVLAKSSQYVVSSALDLARFFRLSELAVGFLLLAVATSLPEFAVGVIAGLANEPGISVGNVFGSNLADIGLILGFAILFAGKLVVDTRESHNLIRILFVTSAVPLLMLVGGDVRFLAGVVLLAMFAGFAYFVLKERVSLKGAKQIVHPVSARHAVLQAFVFVAGLAVLMVSADFSVDLAVNLATLSGLSRQFVGATAVAIGTSIPELAVTIEAVRRRKAAVAWGNAMGSTIVNLTLVLGITLVLTRAAVNLFAFLTLVSFALLVNLALWYFLSESRRLGRREGVVLIAIYLLYLLVATRLEFGL